MENGLFFSSASRASAVDLPPNARNLLVRRKNAMPQALPKNSNFRKSLQFARKPPENPIRAKPHMLQVQPGVGELGGIGAKGIVEPDMIVIRAIMKNGDFSYLVPTCSP